ncbi:MAG: lysine--tRNA ligase [Candidatus Nealsonbacteria bacterium]
MPIENIKENRLKKLASLRKAGVNPYPAKTKRTHAIEEALANFEELSRAKTKITLVGRIRSIREQGALTFLHFEDGTAKIQAFLKKDQIGDKDYRFFLSNFDIGDFLEISGILFETKRGEKTVEVGDFRILTKSTLPLPEKWHGLQDVEERFRKRYLDILMNPEVKEKFEKRSEIIAQLRQILQKQGFMEVETPVLQPIPGGALAKPFKTHLNALDMDLYLRVAPELYLKRLLVAGFEKIYEIGRCFRNEGMDAYHNPDFTMLELYWAYQDRDGLMEFAEKTISDLVKKTKGTTQISYQGKKIDFKTPWKRVKFDDLVKEKKGTDLDGCFKEACRRDIIQPTFVVDHPSELTLLAKAKENDPKHADRFQLVVGGIEMINGFSELNDPQEQAKMFERADIELERKDEDFLEALEYGMPPAAGLGIGIDRLIILLTDCHSLREAILFPTMRPK